MVRDVNSGSILPDEPFVSAGEGRMAQMPVRVDKWLWSVRVYKTRTLATKACASRRVRVNDAVAKPATQVSPGDVVTVKRRDRVLVYAVIEVITKRVSAARARECAEDRSPPPPEPRPALGTAPVARRDPGAGRPTKRERRQIDRLRRRP